LERLGPPKGRKKVVTSDVKARDLICHSQMLGWEPEWGDEGPMSSFDEGFESAGETDPYSYPMALIEGAK